MDTPKLSGKDDGAEYCYAEAMSTLSLSARKVLTCQRLTAGSESVRFPDIKIEKERANSLCEIGQQFGIDDGQN